VTGLQGVGQDGLGGAGLPERGGDDQRGVAAGLVPGRDQHAAAGRLGAAGLEADDPVLAHQRVVVADQAGHRDDRGRPGDDRGQGRHSHRGRAQPHLVGGGAGGGRVEAGRVGVGGAGQAQGAGGGVHPRHERGLAPGVPAGEDPGDVVGRRQQQRRQRLAFGQHLPGLDRYQRVTGASLSWVGGRLRRLDGDLRPRASGRQRMVPQDHVGGHQLGHAGDRHRPGGARPGQHAAADVGGRDAGGRPRDRHKLRLAGSRRAGPERDRGRRDGRFGRSGVRAGQGATGQADDRGQREGQDSPVPPGLRWMHTGDGATPISPVGLAEVTAVS